MTYSISDLEKLSGIQVDTIRIWEKRYKALTPMRSLGNTRYYNDHHLRRLLNIVALSEAGMKISQACTLSDKEIDLLLQKEMDNHLSAHTKTEYYISQLLKYGLAYNGPHFDQLLSKYISSHGMSFTYKEVIYPLLVRLGMMWRRDHICPAQEHFLANIIRQKIFVAIDTLKIKQQTTVSWLLFLPEDEDHDIGLLFAYYLLKQANQNVIFLGGRVPFESLQDAMSYHHSAHLLLFMTHTKPVNEAQQYIDQLSNCFSSSRIHLAGNPKLISQLMLAPSINWIQSIEDLQHLVN